MEELGGGEEGGGEGEMRRGRPKRAGRVHRTRDAQITDKPHVSIAHGRFLFIHVVKLPTSNIYPVN